MGRQKTLAHVTRITHSTVTSLFPLLLLISPGGASFQGAFVDGRLHHIGWKQLRTAAFAAAQFEGPSATIKDHVDPQEPSRTVALVFIRLMTGLTFSSAVSSSAAAPSSTLSYLVVLSNDSSGSCPGSVQNLNIFLIVHEAEIHEVQAELGPGCGGC